jgi:Peptidase_C39 like family
MELLKYPQKPKTTSFRLEVLFNDQNDNSPSKGQREGWRQCNLTCAAMLAKYLKPSLWTEYKDFANGMQDALYPYGDTTDHNAVTKALQSIGIESYFSYTASRDDMASSLFNGIPAILGTLYKAGGHMILAVGRTPTSIIAHNPYGERDGTSDNWVHIGGRSGANETLSYPWLSTCVFDQGNEAGWIRFVTSVDGVSTGIKAGM